MKKKNLILLIILAISLLAVCILYFSERTKDKASRVYRDFAVADTASVNKIFLADKRNNTVLLERKGDYWLVNKQYKVRKDFIETLLETIKRIEVKSPVQQTKLPKVLKDISADGIKVEIYQDDKNVKTYYVGGSDSSGTGTYMILEGSDVPFVMHIPGFSGYLTIRYIPVIDEWRERIVFNYKVQDIEKITVEYPDTPEESFIIRNYGNNKYDLTEIDGSKVSFQFDTLKIKEYISKIKFIGFESFLDNKLKNEKLDSVLNNPMISKFSIEDRNGIIKTLKAFHRQNAGGDFDDDGNLYEWDVNYLYGVIEDDTEIVLLQYYITDPISNKKSEFVLKN